VSDFRPTASLDMLRRRADLLRQLRTFFEERGFLEVETPLLSHDTVVDRHIDPTGVIVAADPRQPARGPPMWLQTSPEFSMKRLLAAGAGPIFQVTRSFRAGEAGRLHNPEFTIVEWYRPGDDLAAGMQLLSDLAERMLGRGPARRITYQEAFRQFASVDPFLDSIEALASATERAGIVPGVPPAADDRDAWLDLLLVSCVEPNLGVGAPTILHDYPPSQAALAVVRDGEISVAERFELYIDGIELANGYHELLDAKVLRERNRKNNALRAADGKPTLPEESRLLAAMEAGLPACAGVALGFDRLVMVAEKAGSIQEVIAFPMDRA